MDIDEPAGGSGSERDERGLDNRIDADSIIGNVVQARDVQGGIHLYSPPEQHQDARLMPRQLPAATRGFVNRAQEIGRLAHLVDGTDVGRPHAVIVIAGSAGVGKTALALHWMHRIRADFTDGDLFVSLRGYDVGPPASAAAVLERLLRDLGVPPDRIPFDLEDRVVLFRSLVAGRRLLILLDNASSASQVRPLIPGAAGPLLVVTSRSRMPSLGVRDGVGYVQVDVLAESDAVALVNEVTQHDRPDDSDADLAELVRLCARLPLALRIAAQRAVSRPAMRLVELIDDLRDTSGLWDALSVQDGAESEDVRTVFAWSYRSLPAQAAWVFRVIGLHPGADVSLPAIAAAAGTSLRDTRRFTDVLVGAFLLEHAAGSRFRMHDLLRAYANAESQVYDPPSVRASVLDRLVCWYAGSADNVSAVLAPDDRLVPDVPTAPGVSPVTFASAGEAVTWFESERQNLVAVARLAEASGRPAHALALALAPSPVYMNYFHFDDWSEMSLAALRSATTHPRDMAVAQENRGKYLLRRGVYGDARIAFTEARRIYEQVDDRRGHAEATNSLGLVCLRLRDLDNAAQLFASATDTFTALDDPRWQGVCRSNLAEARIEVGGASCALDDLDPLLTLFERLGDVAMQGNTLWLLARAHRLTGNPDLARAAIDRALNIADEAHNPMWEGFWLIEAARIQLDLGDPAAAMLSCQVAASLQRQIGDKSREAMALHCTGDVLQHTQAAAEASAFHLQAARQFHDLGEAWNEAGARLGAADAAAALDDTDTDTDTEREQLGLAYACLTPYTDRRATALKHDIAARLATRRPSR